MSLLAALRRPAVRIPVMATLTVAVAALALDFQVLPAVPAAEHDQPVDLIVTEREVIRISRGRRP